MYPPSAIIRDARLIVLLPRAQAARFRVFEPRVAPFRDIARGETVCGAVGYAARQEVRMRLESVGKRYGLRQPWVVRSVSLDVLPGRLIRLEGRNGSGKSTLLRVAAGVSLPSKGRVTGRPHTGYVPERFPGGLPFSGRDYLLHLARVHGLRGPAAARAVDEWLDRLGAAGYAGQPLRTLSKGMCQQVALAQALLAALAARDDGQVDIAHHQPPTTSRT
jgi:ABC-type transport system involved in cytochrome c biogenesis ATPase subunit